MSEPFLIRVCQALSGKKIRYAVVGGHAVALHGAIRGTIDIDVAIKWSLKALTNAEAALQELGLVSRLPLTANDVFSYRDEYVSKRNLVAWNFYNPSDLTEQVDLIVTYDLAGRHLKMIDMESVQIPVLNKKDLIAMKIKSGRPQDIEDASALENLS